MNDADVRTRIIKEATTLFAKKGYGRTSVREVVQAAGVTKPTLYYYFKNKETLFLEIVEFHLERLREEVERLVLAPGTVRERLSAFVEAYLDESVKNADVIRLMLTAQDPSDEGPPRINIMSVHMQKTKALTELITQGMRSGELRADLDVHAAVFCFIGSISLYAKAACYGLPLEDNCKSAIIDLFFSGVKSR